MLNRAVLRESISLFAVESAVLKEASALLEVVERSLVAVESEDSAVLEVVESPLVAVESEDSALLEVVESVARSVVRVASALLEVVESVLTSLFVVDRAPLVAVDKAAICPVTPGLTEVLKEEIALLVDVERLETVLLVEFSAWLVEPIAAELVAVAVVSTGFTSWATVLI